MNMMVAAGKEMAKLVGKENGEEGGGERHALEKAERIFVKESEGAEKLVQGDSLVVSIGDGKLSAGDEASRESGEEEENGEDEGFERWARKDGSVGVGDGREGVPVNGGRKSFDGGI